MERMQGYESAQALTGEYEVLEPGGYICKILRAEERLSKSSKRMLVIYFDIVDGEHANYYKRRYDDGIKNRTDLKQETKWQGVYRQMLEGDNAVGYLKGFMQTLEESNPGFKWEWDESKLMGLLFGGLFGIEEYEKMNGDIGRATKIRYIRTVNKIRNGEFEIPKEILIERSENPFATNAPAGVSNDDELPF